MTKQWRATYIPIMVIYSIMLTACSSDSDHGGNHSGSTVKIGSLCTIPNAAQCVTLNFSGAFTQKELTHMQVHQDYLIFNNDSECKSVDGSIAPIYTACTKNSATNIRCSFKQIITTPEKTFTMTAATYGSAYFQNFTDPVLNVNCSITPTSPNSPLLSCTYNNKNNCTVLTTTSNSLQEDNVSDFNEECKKAGGSQSSNTCNTSLTLRCNIELETYNYDTSRSMSVEYICYGDHSGCDPNSAQFGDLAPCIYNFTDI